VQDFRIAPSEFWRMTLNELDLLTGDRLDRQARAMGRLTRDDLAELEQLGRQAMEREAAQRGAA
jgi:hypothetical protein